MKIAPLSFAFTLGCLNATGFAATVFTENFTYPDGALTTVASSVWSLHSGATPGQVNVAGGAVVVTGSETEDVNANIAGGAGFFFNTGILTATFNVSFSALPTGTGSYFIHFKDSTTSGFRSRVFATTTDATAGSFRLAIADTTTTVVPIPTDLSLNTTHIVTFSIDAATGRSSLSVNGGTAVTATDATSQLNLSTIALRQANNIGTMTIDNIVVDATAAAVPEPSIALLGLLAGSSMLRRRR